MTTEQNNHVLTAINAVMVSFTQQIVEQATKPLVERIARLEGQQEELYDIIKISLKGHVRNAVDIGMAAVKQDITKEVLDTVKIEVLKANVLDAVDDKIKKEIKKITTDSITGFSEAVEEVLQNQPPLNADDIVGLKEFVEGVIEESDSDLERTIREEVENQIEQNDPVEKIREALRNAADSM
jgi:hypothetical protein